MIAIFSIQAICQGAYEVRVNWDAQNCDCLGTNANNYFKVIVSIYDNVANEWVVIDKIVNTSDATVDWEDVPVGEVEDYCDEALQTPSFNVIATVILIETYTMPHVEWCEGQRVYAPFSCQDIAAGEDLLPKITLN